MKKNATITQLDLTSFEAAPALPAKPVETIYSVSSFIDMLTDVLKPFRVTVRGEVNSVNVRGRAVYFTLRDTKEEAVLNCFIWKARLDSMGITLQEGLEVTVLGVPSIFKRYGKLSFDAHYIGLVGEGALRAAFDALKKKLEQAGYFNPERKREISPYPRRIGLITSVDAAAKRDFLTHLGNHGYTIYFKDARVEGINAIDTIVDAIRWFNERVPNLDVLVVTRGGGSLESLQAFNSEAVARAIFGSKIPVISAVGHEVDVSIADLVADLRASTPTDAGKILSAQWEKAEDRVREYETGIVNRFRARCLMVSHDIATIERTMESALSNHIHQAHASIMQVEHSLSHSFNRLINSVRSMEQTFTSNFSLMHKKIKEVGIRLTKHDEQHISVAAAWYRRGVARFERLDETLALSDPHLKLKQGYSIVRSLGSVVKSLDHVTIGDTLQITLHGGEITSQVEQTKPYGRQKN